MSFIRNFGVSLRNVIAHHNRLVMKPEVHKKLIWENPRKLEILENVVKTQISSGFEKGVKSFFHGTSEADDMLRQASNDPEGLGRLEKRMCEQGDDEAGLYGTSCPISAHEYTGAKTVVEVASHGKLHIDADRGTAYLCKLSEKHLLAVYEIDNTARKNYVRMPLLQRMTLIMNPSTV